MKRVLIAGAGSYIGTHLRDELHSFPDDYTVNELDVRYHWDNKVFSGYDAVVIVAGLAHQKETKQNRNDYFRINCDLAFQIASEAKDNGISHLIFLSSMSVYGINEGNITLQTVPNPVTAYGMSKLQAEEKLHSLADEHLSVSILRPPMVYGKDCPGNYRLLSALSQKLPFFPKFSNQRSMIHIDTLTCFLRQLLQSGKSGFFFPQEPAYVSTSAMMKEIAAAHDKRLYLIPGLQWCVWLLRMLFPAAKKAFGSLTYDQGMSQAFTVDHPQTLKQTILKSELP